MAAFEEMWSFFLGVFLEIDRDERGAHFVGQSAEIYILPCFCKLISRLRFLILIKRKKKIQIGVR